MGVLACDRKGCENIMCDFCSYQYGYLCQECKEELIQSGPCSIDEFMRTEKLPSFSSDSWESFVDNEFKSRHGEE